VAARHVCLWEDRKRAAVGQNDTNAPQRMFGRIFGLDGRESIANYGWSCYSASPPKSRLLRMNDGIHRRKDRF
jgi:hypothetical protein